MDQKYLNELKKDGELGFYKFCPVCESEDLDCYQRCSYSNGVTDVIYTYLECNDCRTPSNNTTKDYTIEDLIKDWNKKIEENKNPYGVWREEWRSDHTKEDLKQMEEGLIKKVINEGTSETWVGLGKAIAASMHEKIYGRKLEEK